MKRNEFAIEYLKSALSVNTHVGCSLNCEYCVVNELGVRDVEQIYTPKEAVDLLLKNRLFILDKTPITLNNRSDPLLGNVRKNTFEMLHLLNQKGVKNPKIIISKLPLENEEIVQLDNSLGKNYFFITYSNLPSPLEKVSHNKQKQSLEQLTKRRTFHAIHYWRPLISMLNDSEACLEEVFSDVHTVCESSVISGIRLNNNLASKLREYGAEISLWNGDTKHKYLPSDIIEKITRMRDQIRKDYPLYKHTSCAICASEKIPDYNFHFLNKQKCLSDCLNSGICIVGNRPNETEVSNLFDRLGISNKWHYSKNCIQVSGILNEEERSCLCHSLGYPILIDILTMSPSEAEIRK